MTEPAGRGQIPPGPAQLSCRHYGGHKELRRKPLSSETWGQPLLRGPVSCGLLCAGWAASSPLPIHPPRPRPAPGARLPRGGMGKGLSLAAARGGPAQVLSSSSSGAGLPAQACQGDNGRKRPSHGESGRKPLPAWPGPSPLRSATRTRRGPAGPRSAQPPRRASVFALEGSAEAGLSPAGPLLKADPLSGCHL